MTDPPTAAEYNTEADATAGIGTAARMTRVWLAAKNAFTEPPSTAPPSSSQCLFFQNVRQLQPHGCKTHIVL